MSPLSLFLCPWWRHLLFLVCCDVVLALLLSFSLFLFLLLSFSFFLFLTFLFSSSFSSPNPFSHWHCCSQKREGFFCVFSFRSWHFLETLRILWSDQVVHHYSAGFDCSSVSAESLPFLSIKNTCVSSLLLLRMRFTLNFPQPKSTYSKPSSFFQYCTSQEIVSGKQGVDIVEVEMIGNYAIKFVVWFFCCSRVFLLILPFRIVFDDFHDTGIFSWSYLRNLGDEKLRFLERFSLSLLTSDADTCESTSRSSERTSWLAFQNVFSAKRKRLFPQRVKKANNIYWNYCPKFYASWWGS